MPATLNIKVNITPPEPTAQIEHQWQWRRISGVVIALVFAFSLLFYLVFSEEDTTKLATIEAVNTVPHELNKERTVATLQPVATDLAALDIQPQLFAEASPESVEPAPDLTPKISGEPQPEEVVAVQPTTLANEPIPDNSVPVARPTDAVDIEPADQQIEIEQDLPSVSDSISTTDTIGMALLVPSLVERHALAYAIQQKEPQNPLPAGSIISGADLQTLYYFTELTGLAGQTVHHHWLYNGQVIADIPLSVGSDHWRTYSSKRISASLPGQWRVELRGPEQKLLAYYDFYRQP